MAIKSAENKFRKLPFMQHLITKFTLLFSLLFTVGHSSAGGVPAADDASFIKPYRAVYDANFDFFLPLEGTAIRQLQQQKNGDWLLSHTIDSSLIILKENSLFQWQQGQPKTQIYEYNQKSIGKKKHARLKFDWTQLSVHHQSKEPAGEYDIPSNTLDKLNYQLKLRQDLAANRSLPSYAVADRHHLKNYDFKVVGEEVLETPLGKLNALQIQRVRAADAKRQTTIWLAMDWDYLLVKIKQVEKGKSLEVVMIEGQLDGKPIRGL